MLRYSRIASRLIQDHHQIRRCSTVEQTKEEAIVIPKRIQKDELAVLRALSKTVAKDPTALPYMFHDDPYLLPKSAAERRRYALATESGQKAAQYVIKTKPELFLGVQRDDPKIEAYFPPVESSEFQEPCEEAILERLLRNDMQGALRAHQELKDSGHTISMETNRALLDFLCFHGCQPPVTDVLHNLLSAKTGAAEEGSEDAEESEPVEVQESTQEETKPQRRFRRKLAGPPWKDGNAADILFDSIKEKDAHCYNSMIRGLVKYGAETRAFTLYNEMQERGIQADVHAYNALLEGSTYIRDDYKERWSVMLQLMKQMEVEKVRPNLHTFNALLDNLRIMGALGRRKTLQTISEMKACGVEPSLGTYSLVLMIFYKDSLPPSDIIYDIMDTIEGQEFTVRHPHDVTFFKNAMTVCLSLRDVELAYKVDLLLNTGNNFKVAGDYNAQNVYYGKFFHLVCLMDNAESMFTYYNKLVPSALIPSTVVYMDMLRSLETACAYDHIPQIWEDICMYGHRYRQHVLELLIQVMATSIDASSEMKSKFCSIALDIIAAARESKRRVDSIQFGTLTMDYLVSICLQARELDASWEALQLFKETQKVPSLAVLEDFLQICVDEQEVTKALACLQMGVVSGLTGALGMADKIKAEFTLSTEQRKHLEDIVMEEEMLSGQSSVL
ncbi:small ribosomal subunit protein mS39-like [Diadema antillarum]|uniref:small ribosomal subunit protein mS39-like n=1 Tax=Diadema antillarum TaxID=105358 RepID=UPI003A88F0B9